MNKDKLYLTLYNFKDLAMDTQGQATNKLHSILDRVADGVWNQKETSFYAYSQCAFCCVSPESEHDEDCPVRLARELREELEL